MVIGAGKVLDGNSGFVFEERTGLAVQCTFGQAEEGANSTETHKGIGSLPNWLERVRKEKIQLG